MAIITDLLIAAPMLQDYLVDKDSGLPLSDGVITLYQDNSRTTLKNWYYQSGSPGAYTYIALPNPLTLSGVGTITDPNGNDTIPFYYPYDESATSTTPGLQPYYITVDNSNGERQFTRQNFPFVPAEAGPPPNTTPTNHNLIVNNVFWRNVGSVNATTLTNSIVINGITNYYTTLAPSQHDGFIMQDIQFFKNANGAADTLSFFQFVPPSANPTFSDQILQQDVTPEFYLNMHCTGTGSETTKYIQIPLSLHVKSLSGYTNGYVKLQAMAVTGNPEITVSIFQFLGSGATSPAIAPLTFTLGNSWEPIVMNLPIPSAANLVLGNGGDDALYLQIGLPVDDVFNINIAKPSFYLSATVPNNDYETYDEANAIFSSPRTGDIRVSVNSFIPFGWVPMNDGTIGNPSSNATTRNNADTWLLYNLFWNIAKPYDTGGGGDFNPICQMYTSGGSATDFGSNAIGDFNANKAIALTRMFGRVLLGSAPISSLLTPQSTTFTASNSGGLLLVTTANTVNYFNGMPIVFTNNGGALPTGLVANAIYYVSRFNGSTTFTVADTFAHAIASTGSVLYTDAGSGTNTVTGGVTGSSEGEYAHMQLIGELFNHSHDGFGGNTFVMTAGSTSFSGTGSGTPAATTGNVHNFPMSGQTAFNVTQPGTFYNIFVKL
jgi:hypothetical protein